TRAVAAREHVGVSSPRVLVDDDAVRALEARGRRELDVRHDADSDDYRVARKATAVGRLDRLDARTAVQGADRGADLDVDSSRAVQIGEERRDLLADDTPEHAVGGFEHRDREAAVARDRRHLEADVAAADDDDARAWRQARVERVDVR